MNDGTGMRGWLKAVLFGSLALNLLVAGLAVGVVFDGPPGHPPRDRDPALPFTRAFDEDQRHDLRRALRKEFDKRRGDGSGLIEDYREALAVLRAEPFDAEALKAALDKQGARAETRRERGQQILAEMLAGMSPADRKAYADRLERELDEILERRARWTKR